MIIILVSHYEDHEHDVVTISSTGLQSVITEHAEFYSDSPHSTLKLFLQPASRITSSSDEFFLQPSSRMTSSSEDPPSPFTGSTGMPNFTNNNNNHSNNNSVSSTGSNGSGGGSFLYSSSPRNVIPMNGMNHHQKRDSTNFGIIIGSEGHLHPGEFNHLSDINNSAEIAPPFRTPPRTPPDSPRNPLRTPPGSPKGDLFIHLYLFFLHPFPFFLPLLFILLL